ncbi:hypothetical protein KEF29_03575 [Streptomyces tuirus]|uniref:Uncharacterized protein n=1 Tax=Streptomyces tuirus TaxID=68278 RepID=A0A941J1T1_9ACTN|nr:hypothetical protein [Streptomyces tuirus]
MSSIGKHSPAYTELRTRAERAEDDNRQLIAANEDLVGELTRSIVRECQTSIRAAAAEAENEALKRRVKELSGKVCRSAAEQQRLRQAVINARPRITQVDTQLVRPYSPVVCLPYASPVPYLDTSNDQTQELPILDQPQPWPIHQVPAA